MSARGSLLDEVRRLGPAGATVSLHVAPLRGPATFEHHADAVHAAASTMKVAVALAARRLDHRPPRRGWAGGPCRVPEREMSRAAGHRQLWTVIMFTVLTDSTTCFRACDTLT